MDFNALFNLMDLDRDEQLTREELYRAAKKLGWHWYEAAFFAVLDLLSLAGPISRKKFNFYLGQMEEDLHGPYGRVLLNVPYDSLIKNTEFDRFEVQQTIREESQEKTGENPIVEILNQSAGKDIANRYEKLLGELELLRIPQKKSALLIIDPQRSFTRGAWMESIGPGGHLDIKGIEAAFRNSARLLLHYGNLIETMFSRCPFPPDSYDWDGHFTGIIGDKQPYFIKPGNSIMFPHTNGYRQWVEKSLNKGISTLVIGGCTLNSCVRVSAIETLRFFKNRNLQVAVDLSISGARIGNYQKSAMFGGFSSVESAIREMTASGVRVVRGVEYHT